MFACEFCEISKNTFFTEHLWTITSNASLNFNIYSILFFLESLFSISVTAKRAFAVHIERSNNVY